MDRFGYTICKATAIVVCKIAPIRVNKGPNRDCTLHLKCISQLVSYDIKMFVYINVVAVVCLWFRFCIYSISSLICINFNFSFHIRYHLCYSRTKHSRLCLTGVLLFCLIMLDNHFYISVCFIFWYD